MFKTSKILALGLVVALAAPVVFADEKAEKKAAEKAEKHAQGREDIDSMAKETLDELFAESADAKKLYDKAYGYAVFSNYKFQLIVSGGGGQGVAVNKNSGARTYMKMATGGIGLGIGGKKQSVIFLFEDERSFNGFADNGWQADTEAGAAAGTAAVGADASFRDGLAYYQITKKGLIASADIAGTRFWKDDDLNK